MNSMEKLGICTELALKVLALKNIEKCQVRFDQPHPSKKKKEPWKVPLKAHYVNDANLRDWQDSAF